MRFEVKKPILGFENVQSVEIEEVNELFTSMTSANNKNISFMMLNPYELREYSFDLPTDIKILLDINKDSHVDVFNIALRQEPLDQSTINFLAPIVVNKDNNKVAQVVLNGKKHPDFGMAERISSFKTAS